MTDNGWVGDNGNIGGDIDMQIVPRNYHKSGMKMTEVTAACHIGKDKDKSAETLMEAMKKLDDAVKATMSTNVKKLMVLAAKEKKISQKRDSGENDLCNACKDSQAHWKAWKPLEEPAL